MPMTTLSVRQVAEALLQGGPAVDRGLKVVLRVDAGLARGLSYGHLSRCLLLSRCLREDFGARTRLLMRCTEEGMAHARAASEDVLEFRPDISIPDCDVLVLDLPSWPEPSLVAHCRRHRPWTILVDDFGIERLRADVVLNPSILALQSMYPRAGRVLLGPDYMLPPSELAGAKWSPPTHGPLRLLVTCGGSDPTGLTGSVLRCLLGDFPPGLEVEAVLGPGFALNVEKELVSLCEGAPVRLLRNPASLVDLYLSHHAAVCAGGRTLYELAALGVPAIAVATTDHEKKVVVAAQEAGLVRAGLERWDAGRFRQALSGLAESAVPLAD